MPEVSFRTRYELPEDSAWWRVAYGSLWVGGVVAVVMVLPTLVSNTLAGRLLGFADLIGPFLVQGAISLLGWGIVRVVELRRGWRESAELNRIESEALRRLGKP